MVLFVGAGVSMSVGLPSWQKLIDHMIAVLGIDPKRVERPGESYQALAEYYLIRQGSIGPLRSWMDRHWNVSRERVRQSKLHRLIVELDIPVIYTTNYDRNLEVGIAGVTFEFDRGYQWVDVRAGAQRFRFVNTHLEAFSSDIALDQAD